MKRSYFLYLSIFLIVISAKAQQFQLTENAEVSILTLGPGTELNDAFGHSAFRIKDTSKEIDQVFNYGEYDFNTPNFYLKFAQGKLLYQIGENDFQPFFDYYASHNREIKEQVLNFNLSEKQRLYDYLLNNILPENKKYKYDFFFDNCATKMRDVLVQIVPDKIDYKNDFVTEDKTFRQLIDENVYWNSWGSVGITVPLGAIIDKNATAWQYQFLPEYVFQANATATILKSTFDDGNLKYTESLVQSSKVLYSAKKSEKKSYFFTSPLFILSLLALLIIGITIDDWRKDKRSRFLDTSLFFTTGIIGILLLLLWFATDHTATANNYNLLWAFPINLFMVIAYSRNYVRLWMRQYAVFCLLLLVLMTVHWFTGVQHFSYAIIPLILALAFRYLFLVVYAKKNAVKPLQPVLG